MLLGLVILNNWFRFWALKCFGRFIETSTQCNKMCSTVQKTLTRGHTPEHPNPLTGRSVLGTIVRILVCEERLHLLVTKCFSVLFLPREVWWVAAWRPHDLNLYNVFCTQCFVQWQTGMVLKCHLAVHPWWFEMVCCTRCWRGPYYWSCRIGIWLLVQFYLVFHMLSVFSNTTQYNTIQ